MTDKATLLALAERLEKAEAGSLTLDKEILAALGYPWRGRGYNSRQWMGSACLTASIDAALTLVPEGWQFQIHPCQALVIGEGIHRSIAATPALALCAAALRARAETQP